MAGSLSQHTALASCYCLSAFTQHPDKTVQPQKSHRRAPAARDLVKGLSPPFAQVSGVSEVAVLFFGACPFPGRTQPAREVTL